MFHRAAAEASVERVALVTGLNLKAIEFQLHCNESNSKQIAGIFITIVTWKPNSSQPCLGPPSVLYFLCMYICVLILDAFVWANVCLCVS